MKEERQTEVAKMSNQRETASFFFLFNFFRKVMLLVVVYYELQHFCSTCSPPLSLCLSICAGCPGSGGLFDRMFVFFFCRCHGHLEVCVLEQVTAFARLSLQSKHNLPGVSMPSLCACTPVLEDDILLAGPCRATMGDA